MRVLDAKVRRAVEKDGIRMGEVEVRTDETAEAVLFVCFSASENNDYDMRSIIRSDAKLEIDWYENNLHEAYSDLSVEMFETRDELKTDWGQREQFKESVLSCEGVRRDLAKLL